MASKFNSEFKVSFKHLLQKHATNLKKIDEKVDLKEKEIMTI